MQAEIEDVLIRRDIFVSNYVQSQEDTGTEWRVISRNVSQQRPYATESLFNHTEDE